MADLRQVPDAELVRALRDAGARYPYPPTPNLVVAVRARLVAQPAPGRLWRRKSDQWRGPLRVALAAAILIVVVGAAALINPASRDAVAHFFHVRGVVITRVPSPLPSTSPITSLYLGEQTTFERAQSAVSFHIEVPPELGTPDAVYLDQSVPGGEVALTYKPRTDIPQVRQTGVGLLLTEFRGDLIPGFITKEVGPGTTLEEVSVHGDPGWWIAGQPHYIVLSNRAETLRLASNTLVWEHGGVTYRIESNLSKADAMRIAAGLP